MKRVTPKTVSYSVFYEQDSEGGFVAFVPSLPGCHTKDETLEEAREPIGSQRTLSNTRLEGFTWCTNEVAALQLRRIEYKNECADRGLSALQPC